MGCSSSHAHRYTSSQEEGELCAKAAPVECASGHRASKRSACAAASGNEAETALAAAVLCHDSRHNDNDDNNNGEEPLAVAEPVPPLVVDEACVRLFTSEEVLVLSGRDIPIGVLPGSRVSVRLCDGRRFSFSVPIGYVHGELISIPLD